MQERRWAPKTEAEAAERAEVARLTDEVRQSDARKQRKFSDTAAGVHARTVATLNTQLGMPVRMPRLCLIASVSMLASSARSTPSAGCRVESGLQTPAGHLAGAVVAPAGPAADVGAGGYASERDTAAHIAICMAGYAALADQVSQILDIEDQRQAGK